MPKYGKRLLERKPKSLNRYYKTEKMGALTYVTVPPPPHPLAAQCPTCMVPRGEPCIDQRKTVPWDRRKDIWLDNPHPARERWARKMEKMAKRDKEEREGE